MMETYYLPLYLSMLVGTLVFPFRRLRISTKIVTYFTIVMFGFLCSGLLKFNAHISDLKEVWLYWGIMVLLSLFTLVNDIWIKKDEY